MNNENEDWKNKVTLVWKGKIIEDLKTPCEYGDYLCEFKCDYIEFKLKVCGRLFIDSGNKVGDEISIPMGINMGGVLYETAAEDTPLSFLVVDEIRR
jgi:hypothetical protein